jgi:hypothetical protein
MVKLLFKLFFIYLFIFSTNLPREAIAIAIFFLRTFNEKGNFTYSHADKKYLTLFQTHFSGHGPWRHLLVCLVN